MADLFSRRARASEGSYARDNDKERLRRLRERLIRDGYLKPEDIVPKASSAEAPLPTVDVLGTISANELPIREVGSGVLSTRTSVPAPDMKRGAPELPSQSRVMAEIYQEHMVSNRGG